MSQTIEITCNGCGFKEQNPLDRVWFQIDISKDDERLGGYVQVLQFNTAYPVMLTGEQHACSSQCALKVALEAMKRLCADSFRPTEVSA